MNDLQEILNKVKLEDNPKDVGTSENKRIAEDDNITESKEVKDNNTTSEHKKVKKS
jgi:hypothetical protein